jgi:hypothetical protein
LELCCHFRVSLSSSSPRRKVSSSSSSALSMSE